MILEATFVLAAVATAILLVQFYPDWTAKWFKRIQKFRAALFGLFTLLLASVFIGSGSPALVLWGFALLVLLGLALVIDGPLEDYVT